MKTNVSPRDVELLSAYLDGQLNPRQRARLSARLDKEPELNRLLDDLHRAKMLLSRTPKLKAPRSFKLTPAMVEVPRPKPIFPVFQFATLAAAVLLIVVLVGDFLSFGSPTAAPVAMEAPVESTLVTEEAQAELFSAQEATEAPSLALEAEAPAADAYPAPSEEEGALSAAGVITPTIPAEEQARIASDTLESAPLEPDAGLLAVPEAETAQEEPAPAEIEPAPAPVNWLRVAEIVLVVLIVGFGTAAALLRRKAQV